MENQVAIPLVGRMLGGGLSGATKRGTGPGAEAAGTPDLFAVLLSALTTPKAQGPPQEQEGDTKGKSLDAASVVEGGGSPRTEIVQTPLPRQSTAVAIADTPSGEFSGGPSAEAGEDDLPSTEPAPAVGVVSAGLAASLATANPDSAANSEVAIRLTPEQAPEVTRAQGRLEPVGGAVADHDYPGRTTAEILPSGDRPIVDTVGGVFTAAAAAPKAQVEVPADDQGSGSQTHRTETPEIKGGVRPATERSVTGATPAEVLGGEIVGDPAEGTRNLSDLLGGDEGATVRSVRVAATAPEAGLTGSAPGAGVRLETDAGAGQAGPTEKAEEGGGSLPSHTPPAAAEQAADGDSAAWSHPQEDRPDQAGEENALRLDRPGGHEGSGVARADGEERVATEIAESAPAPAAVRDVEQPSARMVEAEADARPARVSREELVPVLARRAGIMLRDGLPSEMHIQLVPEHLGRVNLKVAVVDGLVTARFNVENGTVKQLVESRLPELKEALESQGLRLDTVNVQCGTDAGSFGESFMRQSQTGGQGRLPGAFRAYGLVGDEPTGGGAAVIRSHVAQSVGRGTVVDALA